MESLGSGEGLRAQQSAQLNAKLDELATSELLAHTRPPASFPIPSAQQEPKSVGAAVAEIDRLRRHLVDSQSDLGKVLAARDELAKKLSAAEVWISKVWIYHPV
jgi:hypothetical protein